MGRTHLTLLSLSVLLVISPEHEDLGQTAIGGIRPSGTRRHLIVEIAAQTCVGFMLVHLGDTCQELCAAHSCY